MSTAETIANLVQSVTKPWAKQRKAEEREANARNRRFDRMTCSDRVTAKDVAEDVIEEAYLKASSNGTLPAHARQIMYAARGEIQKQTEKQLSDQYFIQTLLVDYMSEHPETEGWNVVFDARGHLHEPHTKRIVPLGTLDVDAYLADIRDDNDEDNDDICDTAIPKAGEFPTVGPRYRYGGILFIEKEGFLPLFQEVKLADRYDIAIMSTKGMSVIASRRLIDELCGGADAALPLFVLHDFDKSGFSILGTLQRDTRRYTFQNSVRVIDLGLRLEDVEKYKLESESVYYGRSDPKYNLAENGASKEEITFLGGDGSMGRRVELNAFTSGDLVEWIETKLKKYGVKKVVPDDKTVEDAYRRALRIELLNREIEKIKSKVEQRVEYADLGRGLRRRVEKRLKLNREISWDEVVAEEARQWLEDSEAAKEKRACVAHPHNTKASPERGKREGK